MRLAAIAMLALFALLIASHATAALPSQAQGAIHPAPPEPALAVKALKGGGNGHSGINLSELADAGELNSDGTVRVIISIPATAGKSPKDRLTDFNSAKASIKNKIASAGGRAKKELAIINGVSADVPLAAIGALSKVGFTVTLDRNRRILLSDSVHLIGASALQAAGLNGSGVTVAVIDTGIDKAHPDLAGRVAREQDFYNNDTDATDDNGHGTHVAGIVGASGAGGIRGVAPAVTFWAAKVCDDTGSCPESGIVEAIDWASDYSGGCVGAADIIQISIGGPGDENEPDAIAVQRAADECRVLVVVSAGNDGPGYWTATAPGVAPSALTVGATTKSDAIAALSSRGPTPDYKVKPDVLAPGISILSARAAGTSLGTPFNSTYIHLSGTSMAAPHVAGTAALLMQAHPSWSWWQVKSALTTTANDLGLGPWTQGTGRINATRAARAQLAVSPQSLSISRPGSTSERATLTITNLNSTASLSISLSATSATDLSTNISAASVSFSQAAITIPPLSNATVNLTINSSRVASVAAGYVIVTDTARVETYRVPYSTLSPCSRALTASTNLTGDVETPESCFYTQTSGITLDCQSHSVILAPSAPNKYGFYAYNASNVTVKNCAFRGFDYGVVLSQTNSSAVENVSVASATEAFSVSDSPGARLGSARSTASSYGIAMRRSSSAQISSAIMLGGDVGAYLNASSGNSFSGGAFANNSLHGIFAEAAATGNDFSGVLACSNNRAGVGGYDVYDLGANNFTAATCGSSNRALCSSACGPPRVRFEPGTEVSGGFADRTFITVNTTSDSPVAAGITARLYDSDGEIAGTASSASGALAANFTGLERGLYRFNATVTDFLGGSGSTETRDFMLTSCQTGADMDGDDAVGTYELLAYIGRWKRGEVEMVPVLKSIAFWKLGGGC